MLEDEIRELFDKLSGQVRRDFSNSLRELNLHVGQDNLLCRLWQGDGVTQLQLCEHLKCEPSTVTNMLKTLEKNNFVIRSRDPVDARISRVYLTEKGRNVREPIQRIWNNQQKKMLEDVSMEERLLLKKILKQIENNIS